MRKTPLAVLIASALLSLDATALDLMSAYRDAQAYDSQFSSARAAREANSETLTIRLTPTSFSCGSLFMTAPTPISTSKASCKWP